jgi:hypothetical protein
MNGGQYNDVLANDTYLVAVVKELTTCYLAGGSLGYFDFEDFIFKGSK